MTSRSRRAAAALLAAAALAVVALAFRALDVEALDLLGPLAGHVVHLGAAFVAGCTLVRVPRVAPREALDLILVTLTLGLAFLALLGLLAAWAGLLHPATPWVVDAVALLTGLPRLKPAYERCLNAWRHLDLSVVVASRIPLYAALCAAGLVYLVPPFLPATSDTAAAQLALPAQAALRRDLPAALASRPEEWATPSSALLLHGQLAGGEVGASLFALTPVVLLACGAFQHGRRRLGNRASLWTALCLVSMPALLRLSASDPSSGWLALLLGLAYHEVADWCGKAVGGKIALASLYCGLALAESPRGAAGFAALLAFLFLVQVLVDRHGLFRQLPGIAGMLAIAVAAALPFTGLALALHPGASLGALAARWLPGPADPAAALLAASAPVDSASAFVSAAALADWGHRALEIGPLVLGLLLFVPLVANPPEGLRHALLATAIGALAWIAPAPWGSGLLLLLPLATMAGAAATWMLAPWGWPSRLARVVVGLAAPVTLLVSLHVGPDLFAGARLLAGRVGEADYLATQVPDRDLIEAVAGLPADANPHVLLLGSFTDCRFTVPVTRAAPPPQPDDAALVLALKKAGVNHVAVHRRDDGALPEPALDVRPLVLVSAHGANGRFELYRLPSGVPRSAPRP